MNLKITLKLLMEGDRNLKISLKKYGRRVVNLKETLKIA